MSVIEYDPFDLEWKAIYDDGTTLLQEKGKECEKNFSHINLDKLYSLVIYNPISGMELLTVVPKDNVVFYLGIEINIEFPNGEDRGESRVIYFRRNYVFQNYTKDREVRHCVGLQRTVDGINYQQLVFLNMDGTIAIAQKK